MDKSENIYIYSDPWMYVNILSRNMILSLLFHLHLHLISLGQSTETVQEPHPQPTPYKTIILSSSLHQGVNVETENMYHLDQKQQTMDYKDGLRR